MEETLIVANWKMNGTVGETLKRITAIRNKLENQAGVEIVIAPPFTALYSAQIILQETPFKLAGQDMHWETEGSFTGEISPAFLRDVGCDYVIVGHSERRQHFGETDEMVARKLRAAFIHELKPIFCIGETATQRKEGKTEELLALQIKKGLGDLRMNELEGMVIAYEPVWAIGTGETATLEQIEKAHSFIRSYLARMYDAPTANRMRLLYGGSVTSENARSILKVRNVNGLLVGGASLQVGKFVQIVQAREENQ